MRVLTTIAAACAILWTCVPVAAADPDGTPIRDADKSKTIPPADGEGINIPGMAFGVNRDDTCDGTALFGRNEKGFTLICMAVSQRDDGSVVRKWKRSAPLAGVRKEGSTCKYETTFVAMSPDEKPMLCGLEVKPKGSKDRRKDPVWTVDTSVTSP